jgi:hypothetical protein
LPSDVLSVNRTEVLLRILFDRQKQPKNPEEAATARRNLSSWLPNEQKLIAPRTTVGGQAVEYEIT